MEKCPKCSSENIDHGNLGESALKIGFLSKTDKRFIKTRKPVMAYVCKDCGYTEIYTKVK